MSLFFIQGYYQFNTHVDNRRGQKGWLQKNKNSSKMWQIGHKWAFKAKIGLVFFEKKNTASKTLPTGKQITI